jgi:hypothetical protein
MTTSYGVAILFNHAEGSTRMSVHTHLTEVQICMAKLELDLTVESVMKDKTPEQRQAIQMKARKVWLTGHPKLQGGKDNEVQ